MTCPVCPTCGLPASGYLALTELSRQFPTARPVTNATHRERGRRIATELGLAVIEIGRDAYVARAALALGVAS